MKKELKHRTQVQIKLDDELIAYLDSKSGKSRSAAIRDIVMASMILERDRADRLEVDRKTRFTKSTKKDGR